MTKRVFVADLTHTAQGIAALSFPLGAAFIASYAKSLLGKDMEFKLYKFPEKLARDIQADPPDLLALSNYSWNLELAYKLSAWAKRQSPNLIVVFGGPNFPVMSSEKAEFLTQ